MTKLKQIIEKLSKLNIILAADIKTETIEELDGDSLIQTILELENIKLEEENRQELKTENPKHIILDNSKLIKIIDRIKSEKIPVPIEINRNEQFRPSAKDIESDFKIYNQERNTEPVRGIENFTKYFNSRLQKMKKILNKRMGYHFLDNLKIIKKFMNGHEVEIVGIISKKLTTKNGNIFVELEDETDQVKVIFMNSNSKESRDMFNNASKLVNDEIIGIKGKISNQFIIANKFIWPDIKIKVRKKIEDDFSIAFISDIHAGSKLFMEKNFVSMLKWINGDINKDIEIAKKLKYIVIGGDVADGIGVYPNQEKDLLIPDIYQQYSLLFNMLNEIPDHIHIFIMPGNHDATQRAEPQPPFDESIIKDFKKNNFHFIKNPSFLTLNGIDVLTYHGTSLDSIISAIPNMSYMKPEAAMIELLKRRHLCPIYGENIIIPSIADELVIDKTPDILHMGHIHRNGIDNYKGVKIINSGTWQAKTEFQTRQGHIPTPCQLSIYDSKIDYFKILDFS